MLKGRIQGAWRITVTLVVVAMSITACDGEQDEAEADTLEADTQQTLEGILARQQSVTRQTTCEYRCESRYEACFAGAGVVVAPNPARTRGQAPPACWPLCDDAASEPLKDKPQSNCAELRDACVMECASIVLE